MRSLYHCWVCKKKYKYNKSYNEHIRNKHSKELYDVENSPICIIPCINRAQILEAIDKESLEVIKWQKMNTN